MIVERIFEHAHKQADQIAIYYGLRPISYGKFAAWISHARDFLTQQDLRAGSVAVLDIDSLLDAWVFGLALRSLGFTTIAVRSLGSLDELDVRNIGCVITTIRERASKVPSIEGQFKLIRIAHHLYLNRTGETLPECPKLATPSGGHILLTSGTTGVSKKILIDDKSLAATLRNRMTVYDLSQTSIVNIFQFASWTALGYGVPSCVWSLGGALVIHQGRDIYRSLRVDGTTHACLSPAMLHNLLAAPAEELQSHNTMRLFVTAGPLPAELAVSVKRRLTPHIFTVIGSTEVGVWTLTRIEGPEETRSHSILPSAEVEVVDPADNPLPTGEMGIVRVRADGGATGYLDDEKATREFFRHGYFYTGDLGVFQPDGRLVLQGRVTNVINFRGDKLAAEPIEQGLQNRLKAEGVCILSMPSRSGDEEIHVVIQSRRAIGKAQLASAMRAEMPGIPHARVHFVEEIPRNDVGKIDRVTLKKKLFPANSG